MILLPKNVLNQCFHQFVFTKLKQQHAQKPFNVSKEFYLYW